jgi:hypothetical protein
VAEGGTPLFPVTERRRLRALGRIGPGLSVLELQWLLLFARAVRTTETEVNTDDDRVRTVCEPEESVLLRPGYLAQLREHDRGTSCVDDESPSRSAVKQAARRTEPCRLWRGPSFPSFMSRVRPSRSVSSLLSWLVNPCSCMRVIYFEVDCDLALLAGDSRDQSMTLVMTSRSRALSSLNRARVGVSASSCFGFLGAALQLVPTN